jgi:hypothetical protein
VARLAAADPAVGRRADGGDLVDAMMETNRGDLGLVL